MKRSLKSLFALFLVFCLGLGAACAQEPQPKTEVTQVPSESATKAAAETAAPVDSQKTDADKPADLRPVTVILDYVINTNHSGLFAALDKGYYADEGLDVQIVEPQEGVSLQILATGKADFATSYQEDLTYALTQDEPLPLKAIATIIQNNTSGFASHKEKNITKPADFAGKTYAGWGSAAEKAIIQAAVKQAGEDPDSVTFVTAMDTSYASLEGDIDLMWFFEGWDMIAAKMEGLDLNYIPCRDIDERLNYYTPILVTRNDLIDQDPDLVKAFMRATGKGYAFASDPENVEEMVQILLKYSPELDLELLTQSQSFLAGEYGKGADRWGLMKDEVWTGYADFMEENGLISKVLSPEDYFTNAFIPEK
ncbi:MAG: ABC transporter substrate-binding protein [Eubacteriales bacterium]|nr:ABC transporter substrate-binding protein [Clostridiales bacterium]MDY5835833.1 ABC transporter substrate-binding protein [Eubacteriales bacterium]